MSILGGAIPLLGGAVSGAAGAWSEKEQDHFNRVAASWLQLQKDEIKEIGVTIAEILTRLDLNDEDIRKRIESPEYLSLLKKCFRDWSAAESEAKRILVRNLLSNAAVNKICTDDVKGHAPKPKRTISAAGRKRIAAAQRARWAKIKRAA